RRPTACCVPTARPTSGVDVSGSGMCHVGGRPYARCMTETLTTAPAQVDRVVRACRAMVAAGGPLPSAELERITACSARQLTRDFDAVVGVSPRTFGQAVRTGEARRLLREHEQVTRAVWA